MKRVAGAPRRTAWAAIAILALAAVGAMLPRSPARACMICDEDKVAATYDAGVVAAARSRRHVMFFAALEGPVTPGDSSLTADIARRLERQAGVDRGTARVSLAPPAVSLSWDPKRTTHPKLLAALARSLAPRRLSLRPIEAHLPD